MEEVGTKEHMKRQRGLCFDSINLVLVGRSWQHCLSSRIRFCLGL